MILSVEFECWKPSWENIKPEDYAALRAVIPGLPSDHKKHDYGIYLVDDEALRVIARLGLTVNLKDDPSIDTMLVKLQRRVEAVEQRAVGEPHQFSDRVQITIPDLGLLYIDEVTYLDDCCTDRLQEHLADGWRILAVCPPNAQRRPDYILGRRKR